MKHNLFIAFSLLSTTALVAQEPADALRFSWTTPSGTARQQAVGGAMTSLGGDLTATFVNPAGLGFYKTGDFALSPAFRFGKNKSSYFGREEKDTENRFSLGASGFVLGTGTNSRSKIRSIAFGLGVNSIADFKSEILYRGSNTQSSYSQKFIEELNNSRVQQLEDVEINYPFGSSLAYNTFLVDSIGGGTPGNFRFQSPTTNLLASGLLQEQTIRNRGGIYEFALGVGVNLRDKLMLGGTLGIPVLNYEREAVFTEADATSNEANGFNYTRFTENLTTKGTGINAKLGLIYKPQEYWRIGLAFHTPTLYSLTDNYETSLEADLERADDRVFADYSKDYTNNAPSEFKYMLATPYKAMASISYVLREIEDVTRQRGFLTADVEYVNYKASSFSVDSENGDNDESTKSYLKSLNRAIDNAYKGAFNFKAGGELKFTTLMVRLGGAYYGNPYKKVQGDKGSRVNLSGGLGYRDKGFFIDLTYVHNITKNTLAPYRLESGMTPVAQVRATGGNVLMTFGLKF